MKQPPRFKVGDKVNKKDERAEVMGHQVPFAVVRDREYSEIGRRWSYHIIYEYEVHQYGFTFYEDNLEPYDDEIDQAFKLLHEEAERKLDKKLEKAQAGE